MGAAVAVQGLSPATGTWRWAVTRTWEVRPPPSALRACKSARARAREYLCARVTRCACVRACVRARVCARVFALGARPTQWPAGTSQRTGWRQGASKQTSSARRASSSSLRSTSRSSSARCAAPRSAPGLPGWSATTSAIAAARSGAERRHQNGERRAPGHSSNGRRAPQHMRAAPRIPAGGMRHAALN